MVMVRVMNFEEQSHSQDLLETVFDANKGQTQPSSLAIDIYQQEMSQQTRVGHWQGDSYFHLRYHHEKYHLAEFMLQAEFNVALYSLTGGKDYEQRIPTLNEQAEFCVTIDQ